MTVSNEKALCITFANCDPDQKRDEIVKAIGAFMRHNAVSLETGAAYTKDWQPLYTMGELLEALTPAV